MRCIPLFPPFDTYRPSLPGSLVRWGWCARGCPWKWIERAGREGEAPRSRWLAPLSQRSLRLPWINHSSEVRGPQSHTVARRRRKLACMDKIPPPSGDTREILGDENPGQTARDGTRQALIEEIQQARQALALDIQEARQALPSYRPAKGRASFARTRSRRAR